MYTFGECYFGVQSEGEADGLASVKSWLELCPAVEGIFITADLTVYVTEGIASLVKVLDSDVRRKALILHNR